MSDQLVQSLTGTARGEPKKFKLIARKTIQGPRWGFRRGQILVGYREEGGTWRVWAPGTDLTRGGDKPKP